MFDLSSIIYGENKVESNKDEDNSKNIKIIKGKSLMTLVSNYTIVDIETTGFDPKYDSIIEISALKVRNDKIVDTYSSLIKPDSELFEFVEELTGITNSMLNDSPKINGKIKDFINFIGEDVVIGHNVNFDINFICTAYKKYCNLDFQNDFIDTMRLARFNLKELKHHRLKDLVKYFNLEINNFHRGLDDCETTLKVYLKLKESILKEYESVDNFEKSFKKRKYHYTPIKNITRNCNTIDITNPLYNSYCVFTGALQLMRRADAMQCVINIGGFVQDNANKKTNYLIVGNTDYLNNVKSKKTSKMKKVEELQLKGYDICILSENVFYELLNIHQ